MTPAPARLSLSMLAGRTGRGVRIAVVDTGIHAGHPHVGAVEHCVAFDDRGNETDDVVDRLGHGTAVAAAMREKAPDVSLISAKVFDRTLSATGLALASAIRWAADRRVDVINLSLGTQNSEHRRLLAEVVDYAHKAGVDIVAAAPDGERVWLPGALPGVIAVSVDWDCPRDECVVSVDGEERMQVTASGFPRPIPGVPPERNLKGQSFAVANATAFIALAMEGEIDRRASARRLLALQLFVERRREDPTPL
jgi:subtilisin family serine protease